MAANALQTAARLASGIGGQNAMAVQNDLSIWLSVIDLSIPAMAKMMKLVGTPRKGLF